ncbi:DUF5995 family protein [Pelagicoccus sp. SDUM812002]|uniref:DUF5995 family protein n=1 Tax=Pelagicoccus sp. SDUM812002 TaxID=3041266 RepID=UPI0028100D12|nr:DUF5995 family protein [Pelagicoccus sp. SDUM812002]MDQ8185573.1 DUF5995 family protein [Pelagicoccus sp. SDUM812002]
MIRSIDEVILELDQIVLTCIDKQDPLGYFASLYKRVTIAVKDGIANKAFEDNARMEKLDIMFASRYMEAYRAFQTGKPTTQSWNAAFSTKSKRLITLQHLLLGMNAHISLDLGVAAARTSPENPLALKNDFYSINRVLESLIEDTQQRLTHIFRPLGLADRLLGPIDEKLSIYSIAYARDKAWTQTLELSLASSENQSQLILERDIAVARFSACLRNPKRLSVRLILLAIRLLERGDTAYRIKLLDTLSPTIDS